MRKVDYPITAFGVMEPHSAQRRVLAAHPSRNLMYLGGRGSGKTVVGILRSLLICMRPENAGCAYAIVAPTYRLLTRVHCKSLLDSINSFKDHTGWSPLKRYYKHDQRMVLRNNCEIFLASFSNVDRLRSMTLSAGVFLDEIEVDSDPMETLGTLAGSIRGVTGTQSLLVTTTPRGLRGSVSHWVKKTTEGSEEYDPNYQLIISKTQDNPYINESFIDRLRSSMSKVVFDQEVNAKITRPSATALGNEWNRETHLINYRHKKGTPYAIAVDPGYSNASVLFIAQVSMPGERDREVIFREFHPEEQSFDRTILDIKKAVREIGTDPYLIGSDRAIPTFNKKLISTFPSAQVKTMRTREEQQVWAGIDRIRSLLDPNEGAPILYASKELIKTPKRGIIVSIENLRRKVVNGEARDQLDKSGNDEFSHAVDALAYFVKGKYGRRGYTSVYDSGGAADAIQFGKGRFGKL